MNEVVDEQEYQPTRKPTFLVVLAILSLITIVLNFFQYIMALLSGPMNQDAWEIYEATMYESVGQMNDVGMDGMATMIEQLIQMSYIANFDYFVMNNLLQLVAVLIGAAGVVFMLRLKKIGFHLYVIYSLLPIIITYLLFPIEVIPTFIIIAQLIISAIFCVLYALNLKHLK
jgi:hypothetical protein